ncbi:MAG TPA: capsule assembly Wzi family protein [Candidatus Acidoferrum sp.]|nr:capsule assembly Wzi family protein [Candidatus Acidoferrum sp.]
MGKGLAAGLCLFCIFLGTSEILGQEKPDAAERQADKTQSLSAGSNQESAKPASKTEKSTPADTTRKNPPEPREGIWKDFFNDQKQVWTSPSRIRFADTTWLVPLGGVTAGLLLTDRQLSGHLSRNPNTIQHYRTLGTAGVASLVGVGGGFYLWGKWTHEDHRRETGFLAGEAVINSLVVVEVMKYSTERSRPFQGDGGGKFLNGGTSFPSEHAAAAWAVAGVIAREYPNPLTKLLAYGAASAVTLSRVKSRDHFPSDVLVGSVIGELVARNIYRRRHDPAVGDTPWESSEEALSVKESKDARSAASPYVPLDSWVYPALDRLAGLEFVDSGFAGMRPWTRRECARLLVEAQEKLGDEGTDAEETVELLKALEREFRTEMEGSESGGRGTFRVESVYSRTEYISGTPLSDGYHFGQTVINDFGRPHAEGWNTINGFSAYTTQGPWVAYVRGEWQTAPSAPALPLTARQTIQVVDILPQTPPGTPRAAANQFQLLDAYVGLTLSEWELSFGRQSLWWGPGQGGPMMFSDNARPINMFRVNRVTPFKLPSFLGWLGPMRMEFFLGQLSGYEFVFSPTGFNGQSGVSLAQQPFIHGQKLSFKPTPNLEFGVFRTTIYGGPGYPLTSRSLVRSLFSGGNQAAASPLKAGDRRSGVDFSYRLPLLRNWLTFYGDGFTDDEFSPIGYFDRSAWHAGLYLSHFPGIAKLDLRVEGVYTDNPLGGALGHGFYYFNDTWRSGYQNDGNLIGSWIGRDGQGAQAWGTYWLNAHSRLQTTFRHEKISQQYIPGGGTLSDFGVGGEVQMRRDLSLSIRVQHERWFIPVMRPAPTDNITSSLQVLFSPEGWRRKKGRGTSTPSDAEAKP